MNLRDGIRGTTVVLIAVVCLLLVSGGVAVGAKLITGKDVKNGSLTSKDVKNETLAGKDVKNGTLVSKDVKNATLIADDVKQGTLTSGDVKDGNLTGTDIKDGTVDTADLANGSVTATRSRPERSPSPTRCGAPCSETRPVRPKATCRPAQAVQAS